MSKAVPGFSLKAEICSEKNKCISLYPFPSFLSIFIEIFHTEKSLADLRSCLTWGGAGASLSRAEGSQQVQTRDVVLAWLLCPSWAISTWH